jgi:hypothetical protein
LDAQDDPALKERLDLAESEDEKLRIALEWYGDEGHPQPAERTEWLEGIFTGITGLDTFTRTPDWGHLPELEDVGVETETGTEPAATAERPSIPNLSQINSYTYATLQKAVKILDGDGTLGDVQRDARLVAADSRRVRLMMGEGLLRLNESRKLIVDERVARLRSRYVLRYLSADDSRWLDPDAERQGQ